jgi:hypothetical protein
MKIGKNLQQLAAEVYRQAESKRDFIAPTNVMEMNEGLGLGFANQDFGINDLAHKQIAEFTGVPGRYYDVMRAEQPELLRQNVNTWFKAKPAQRLVRTLDGNARAFLSNSYRPLDNLDLAEAVLPVLEEMNLQIVSADITERRLYIKAVDRRIERDVPKGHAIGDGSHVFFDTLSPAISIYNSEVGYGALGVDAGTITKMCTNLMWIPAKGMRKYHVGAKMDLGGEEIYRMLSDSTRKATDKAVFMQIRDVVKNAFDEAKFDALVEEIKGTSERQITGDVVEVVNSVAERYLMTSTTRQSVLKHLIEGGSLTQYGLANAVTRAAEDEAAYDDASNFEKVGGSIMVLNNQEWKALGAGEKVKKAA